MTFIPEFSQKHGRIFFHGMPYYAPSANTYFRSKELVDKLTNMRALGGDVSASTFINGTPHHGRDFGGAWKGVILTDGEIIHVSASDSGTVMQPDGRRIVIGGENDNTRTNQTILQRQGNDPYNEIVVRDPVVGGVYIKLDPDGKTLEEQKRNNRPWDSINRITQVIQELQYAARHSGGPSLPVYAILNGQVRDVHDVSVHHLNQYSLSAKGFEELKEFGSVSSPQDQSVLDKWNAFVAGKNATDVFNEILLLGPALEFDDLYKRGRQTELSDIQKVQALTKISHAWDDKFLPHLKQKILEFSGPEPIAPTIHGETVPLLSNNRIAQRRAQQITPTIAPHLSRLGSL